MNTAAILDIIKHQALDAILISSPDHLQYLTSYVGFSSTERDAYLLITPKKIYLFTNSLLAGDIRAKLASISIIENTANNSFAKNLAKITAKEKIDKFGFESSNLTVTEYLSITEHCPCRFISVDLNRLRITKSSDEIDSIKKACQLAQKAFQQTQKKIIAGITEKEVADLFEMNALKIGAKISFPTIVCFGKNAAVPHHLPNETKLKTTEIVLMDFGVKVNSYCSDISRTFFVGKPRRDYENVVRLVEQAQQKAIELITKKLKSHQEISASEVDNAARQYIVENNYPSIPHALGHGIGIKVHEAPKLGPASVDRLEEGMVFSIEPGIYLEGKFGVRIEDIYTIHHNSLIKLS